MKGKYKGFEIEVVRDECLGGWSQLFYSVYTPTGFEIIASFENSSENVSDKYNELKDSVDDIIMNPREWFDDDEDCLSCSESYSEPLNGEDEYDKLWCDKYKKYVDEQHVCSWYI